MVSKNAELLITISPLPEVDDRELTELSEQLAAALRESDADSIEPVRGGGVPAGAKGEPLSLAALLITIAPTAVEGLIRIIQNWVSRRERGSVKLRYGDVELTITGEPSARQQQFAAAFSAQLKQLKE
jgi:hypothetical protein